MITIDTIQHYHSLIQQQPQDFTLSQYQHLLQDAKEFLLLPFCTCQSRKHLLEIIVLGSDRFSNNEQLLADYPDLFDTIAEYMMNSSESFENDAELLFLHIAACSAFPFQDNPFNQMLLQPLVKYIESDFETIVLQLLLKQQCYTELITCDSSRDVLDAFLRGYNRGELQSESCANYCQYILKWEETCSVKAGFSYLHLSDFNYIIDVKLRELNDAFSSPNSNSYLLTLMGDYVLSSLYSNHLYRYKDLEQLCRNFLSDTDDSRYPSPSVFFEWKECARKLLDNLILTKQKYPLQ
jgi:hypothetical protein